MMNFVPEYVKYNGNFKFLRVMQCICMLLSAYLTILLKEVDKMGVGNFFFPL